MIRANRTDLKMEKLRGNPVEIYVMKFISATNGQVSYVENIECSYGLVGASMHDNWFEADWYDTPEEVESNIAPYHRKTDDQVNWIEAICDWEASGYTKPHSLLNAAETCKKYHPDKWHIVEPLLKKGGLLK